MKLQKNIFYVFIAITITVFIPILLLDKSLKIYDILLSFFTGSILISINSLAIYFNERNKYLYKIKTYIYEYLLMTRITKKMLNLNTKNIPENLNIELPRYKTDILSQARFDFFRKDLIELFNKQSEYLFHKMYKRELIIKKYNIKTDKFCKELDDIDMEIENEIKKFIVIINKYFKIICYADSTIKLRD